MNKYEQARYDKDFCISCGKRPYIEGNKRCNECIKLLREKSKADYYFKKSHGICVKCGQEKAVEGRVKCADCLAKGYKVGDKRKDTPKYKEYQKQYNYNRYHYCKEHGLCVKCGKPMYKDSNRLCYEHYIQEKTTDKNRSLKWKNILN